MEQYSPNLARRNPTGFQERGPSMVGVVHNRPRDCWRSPSSTFGWMLGLEHWSNAGHSSLVQLVGELMTDADGKKSP